MHMRRKETSGGVFKSSATVRQVPQLKNQIVRFIYNTEDGDFFLVACHNYDQSLDILYSEEHNFKVEFDYKIEPGIVRVYDFLVEKT